MKRRGPDRGGRAGEAARLAAEAEAAERGQDLQAAVTRMARAVELEPRDAELRLRLAFFRTCLREYDEAGEDLRAAARELPPSDARPARALAHLAYVQGRWGEAYEAAERIETPYYQDDFLRGVLAAKLGFAREAERCLERLRPSNSGWRDLLAAFQAALRDDWQEAAAAAERAARAPNPIEQPERLKTARGAFALKAWRARAAPAARKTERPRGGTLRLISLGVDPPRNVTLDALEAVRDCDVLFVNIASDLIMDLLAVFCRGEVRPINFVNEETRERSARRILAAAEPGKIVGYATYGHVMMLGPLTILLLRLCRRQKLSVQAYAGVTIIGRLLADAGVVLGDGFDGFQLYAARGLAAQGAPLNPRAALAVYLSDVRDGRRDGFYRRLQERLCAAYGAGHEAQVWGPEGLERRLKLGALHEARESLDGQRQLLVPALPRGGAAGLPG
ncbi:MAG: hypothetical protein KGM24_09985 [Elusimicrobia bacterium]|nr:hypothetical protein [Elusimicrobiota bacterium]